MNRFRYLKIVLTWEGRVERAIKSRIAAAWRDWKKISRLLTKKRFRVFSFFYFALFYSGITFDDGFSLHYSMLAQKRLPWGNCTTMCRH